MEALVGIADGDDIIGPILLLTAVVKHSAVIPCLSFAASLSSCCIIAFRFLQNNIKTI